MPTWSQSSEQGGPAQPSKAQLALALMVIRTKPVDWTLAKHIENLRYNNYEWGGEIAAEADLWKKSFDQSQVNNAVLRQQISELQNKLSLVHYNAPEPSATQSGSKRKATEELQAAAQSKRKKPGNARVRNFVNAAKPETFPQPHEDVPREVYGLCQSAFLLDTRAKAGYECSEILASHVRELNKVITKACGTVLPGGKHASLVQPGSVNVLVGLAGRFDAVYLTILRVIDLDVYPEDRDGVTFGVVNCVRLIETLLGGLYTVARSDFDRRVRCFANSEASDSEETHWEYAKGMYHEERHYTDKYKYHDKLEALAKMLYSLFALLQPTQPRHGRLLESLLRALLNHVGRALAKVVFDDWCETIAVPYDGKLLEKAVNDAPQPIKDDFKHCGQSYINIETAVARSQAKYLVAALRLAIDKVDSLTATKDGPVATFMADKIQNTLLRGLFGEDEAFGDCLRQVAWGNEDVREARAVVEMPHMGGDEEDCDAWFIGKVWEIVGWDVLEEKELNSSARKAFEVSQGPVTSYY